MKMKMKKGFTIVELLMVITVIAVLLGIVTTAAQASMRAARERRAHAMREILKGGLAVYHRQHDKWPDAIETYANNGEDKTFGPDNSGEYDKIVKQLLEQSTGADGSNPVMDPTGLMVMSSSGREGSSIAIDYRTALTEHKLDVKNFTIVYPSTDGGKAKRFTIKYKSASDSVTVEL